MSTQPTTDREMIRDVYDKLQTIADLSLAGETSKAAALAYDCREALRTVESNLFWGPVAEVVTDAEA